MTKYDDLVKTLRGSCYLAFEDGTNDYNSAHKAADRIEELEAKLAQQDDLVQVAEQRGYANAMEAERKLHECRIKELEATLDKIAKVLVEAMIIPEAWMMSGFPDMHSEAKEQIITSVKKARAALEEGKDG